MGPSYNMTGDIIRLFAFHSFCCMALPDDNRVAIAAKGGVEAIVAAMGGHAGNAEVQQWGCGALAWLANNGKCCLSVGCLCVVCGFLCAILGLFV